MSKLITTCKKNLFFSLVIASLFLCTAFLSCKSSIDDMLKDYNSHYTPTEDIPEVPGPGDPNFSSSAMLSLEYAVKDNSSLNLIGPPKCKEYKWTIIDPFIEDGDKIVNVKYPVGFDDKSQRYVIYIPTSGLLRGVYQLKLTVVGNNNITYEDVSELIIYQHTY